MFEQDVTLPGSPAPAEGVIATPECGTAPPTSDAADQPDTGAGVGSPAIPVFGAPKTEAPPDAAGIKVTKGGRRKAAVKVDDVADNEAVQRYHDLFRRCVEAEKIYAPSRAEAGRAKAAFFASVFVLGVAVRWDDPAFEAFRKKVKLRYTKASRANPFIAIIVASSAEAGGGIDNKQASPIGQALLYARSKNVSPEGLNEFMSENGGVQGCVKAYRKEKRVSEDANRRGNEDENVGQPARRRGPMVIRNAPAVPEGEVQWIVTVRGGKAEFTRALSAETEAVEGVVVPT